MLHLLQQARGMDCLLCTRLTELFQRSVISCTALQTVISSIFPTYPMVILISTQQETVTLSTFFHQLSGLRPGVPHGLLVLGLLMLCQSPNVRAPCIVTTMSLNMPHSVYIQARRHIILSGVVTLSELLEWSNHIQEQGEYWASSIS